MCVCVPDALHQKKKSFGRVPKFDTHGHFFRRVLQPSPLGPFHINKPTNKLESPETAILDGSLRLAALVLSDESEVTPQSLCSGVSKHVTPQTSVATATEPLQLEREGRQQAVTPVKKALMWDKPLVKSEELATNTETMTCDAETMTPKDPSWCVIPSPRSLNFA